MDIVQLITLFIRKMGHWLEAFFYCRVIVLLGLIGFAIWFAYELSTEEDPHVVEAKAATYTVYMGSSGIVHVIASVLTSVAIAVGIRMFSSALKQSGKLGAVVAGPAENLLSGAAAVAGM